MNKRKISRELKIRSKYKRISFDNPLIDIKKSLEDIKNGRVKAVEESIIFKDLSKKRKYKNPAVKSFKEGIEDLKQGRYEDARKSDLFKND